MIKHTFNHLVALYPSVLWNNWKIENVSGRYEGEKWETFWFRVITPTGVFRVKEFFLDIMEPVFPDSCMYQAEGECFQYEEFVYWRGVNYKGKESYVTSKWKTQIEVSIDEGFVGKGEMEKFLQELQPVNMERAKDIMNTPFHKLSFQAKVGRGGEISRCHEWNSPHEMKFSSLPVATKLPWKLESVGIGNEETQYVYWDEKEKLYALWVCRHKNRSYYPYVSWTKNYGVRQVIDELEYYSHPQRGTVVYQDLGNEQIAYVFRGNPCTTLEEIKKIFSSF
ncbi:hypothetical protein D0U04_19600 [Bacillus clarus]|uniref:Uncharacterized protein n=1 Tax=Bacillus clarus TaxID=2338372 RepID=A0A090ZDK1_9BACI|nr:hypothetical protein [Bacillus clarus]KFN02341.1 hypothetical protein DJ93_169 [Bacillus clarus]RFT65084.1 hypothetical protein D0U04_19600 [Bacillus clarus]